MSPAGGARNLLFAALLSLVLAVPLLLTLVSAAWAGTGPTESEARAKLGRVEIPFITNEGQVDERVAYYARTFAGTVFVTTKGELVYSLPGPARDGGDQNNLPQILQGASRRQTGAAQREPGWTLVERFSGGKVRPRAAERSPTNVSYFVGNDPARWRSEVASFGNVELGEVWPGVEVQLRAQGSNVEKIYRVRPGARAQQIWMEVAGAQGLGLGEDGALLVRTGHGEVNMRRPVAYQEQEKGRVAVAVAYRVRGSGYGFALAAYDPRYPVVIDPLLQSTYLGGATRTTSMRLR